MWFITLKNSSVSDEEGFSYYWQACEGRNSCSIEISNAVFGDDPCHGTVKTLAVEARCVPSPSIGLSATKWKQVMWWMNSQLIWSKWTHLRLVKVAFHTQVMMFRMFFHNIIVGELRLDSIWGMLLCNLFNLNPNYEKLVKKPKANLCLLVWVIAVYITGKCIIFIFTGSSVCA